ncbi:hypothetical protein AYO21_00341 [Fonsecaea monophora]|uniref:RRM domain-containing protein n=2 Tax=Fonsecaea TaxID=40354 RepID=A0A0D2HG17_9EURO|nr:uncharacterized protein Z517_02629 [Fonsecaea pedrosoi CBS 271.37]XP_022517657.1 hypothetical protein AYO21_00341 [Fonsecaea monophora]KAH0832755.1 RNA recognition motif containing protein [Fonsecaea pedrosoi]KIW83384.1 hypothetical protein Z517_02629 [Fonsecaea pedrosoi CBS 271.37]OAG45705.1 hypothetical protein AYO21_00341 [Fonsecaea monophora]
MADFEDSAARYEDDRGYERRDRSASPRGDRDDRNRSRSPNGRDRAPPPPSDTRMKDADDESLNNGSNLFVTGIHPRLTEADVSRLFEKYGDVESCSIMLDPHTKESRGFGFVKMVSNEQAEAAKEGLQGEVVEGRVLSIEKARRARPRTPTPGKYFGPPKRGDFRGPPRGGYRDRYDDRRGGYSGRRDDYRGGDYRGEYRGDYRGGSRYDDYERRGYGGGGSRRERDEGYGGRGIDRYEGRREEGGYSGGGSGTRGDRRGYYDRNDERSYPPATRDEAPREYAGGRDYAREDRYASR